MAVAGLLSFLSCGPTLAQVPPRLELTLRPALADGAVERVHVTMGIEEPGLAAGEALLRLPLTIVGIPTAAYQASDIEVHDEEGEIALEQAEEAPRPEGIYRRYVVTRATRGDVEVRYAARPRQVSETTNNGPLFDMREENGGFTSAGITFLAVPVREGPFRLSLRWDLQDMAPGSIGIWSLGEGDTDRHVAAQQLAFSFYAAGPLRAYRPAVGGRLTLYALSEAPFDLQELTDHVGALYDHMAGFFGEGEGEYRVIARQNPYRGRGGTALPRSFMFGYHAPSRPTLDDLQAMLSHEIAHAWPAMAGEHGETAWYSEGAAEYYSAVLGRRAGVFSEDEFLAAINRRARNYFAHPFRGMSNAEAAGRFWSDPFAQQVPYGRGFLYLAQTDAAIRAATGGRRSLDDVVLALRARQQADEAYGIPAWLELVGNEIGRDRAQRDFERMASGQIVRPASAFAPCLIAVPERARRLELGFARRSLNDDATVEGLVSGSNAARAGVREGDRILAHTELDELSANPSREMLLTIERNGEQLSLSYLPRAEAIEAYRWVRNPHVAPDQCRI